MPRGLKFRILDVEGLYYPCSEKGADQLRGHREADLRLCLRIYKKPFFSHDEAHKALIFLILGLQIFFQNIKVGGGKKIKIKITRTFFLFNLKLIWIGEKKITKIV